MADLFKKLGVVFFLFIAFEAAAQKKKCVVLRSSDPLEEKARLESFEKWLAGKISERRLQRAVNSAASGPMKIPMVFHIVHIGEPYGVGRNVPDEQVYSQLRVINEDYNRRNKDASQTLDIFKSVASSLNVEFVLAKQDPDGNPTNGIVRLRGSKAEWNILTNDERNLKKLSQWDPEHYLNIWVTDIANSVIGYSSWPVQSGLEGDELFDDTGAARDGVIVDYQSFGSIEDEKPEQHILFPSLSGQTVSNKGRTLTHELGHYLGLFHTFVGKSCFGRGDYCEDTPPQNAENYTCNLSLNTCGQINQVQNYMDYSPDDCMNLFTADQVERMEAVLANSPRRRTLVNAPGTQDPEEKPKDYDVALVRILSPAVVQSSSQSKVRFQVQNKGKQPLKSFKLLVVRGESRHEQQFTGLNMVMGEKQTFETQLPQQFGEFGKGLNAFEVSLSLPSGKTDEKTENNRIAHSFVINSDKGEAPFSFRFDEGLGSWMSFSTNPDLEWKKTSEEEEGAHFLQLDFLRVNESEQVWLVSPVLNFEEMDSALLRLDTKFGSANAGTLELFALRIGSENYEEVPARAEVPLRNSWTTFSNRLDDLTDSENAKVRLAMKFTVPAASGVLQLDNLKFYESFKWNTDSNVEPQTKLVEAEENNITVYPNPTFGQVYLNFNYKSPKSVKVSFSDVRGTLLFEKNIDGALNQTHQFDLSMFAKGIVFVVVRDNDNKEVRRLLVR
ncbi:MAG: T9SS type A sorting domain-containing protein [Cytophagales bacterium]|nr:T9SS type A sorting domain-containing protein [Cytophagales bacterium]